MGRNYRHGEKLRDTGVTQDLNNWIIDGTRQWRKLFIKASDPFTPEAKPPTMYFTCSLCKTEYRENEAETVANRQFCRPCAKRVQETLEQRNKKRQEDPESQNDEVQLIQAEHESASPSQQHRYKVENKVKLPGIGEQIELRKIFRPSKGSSENIQ